jgi:DNA-binding CsgD family transcriptional regulator
LGNPRYNELFTSKEKEILQLVVEGKTTKEISEILNKSIHTINTHRKNIFQKTESKTIAELVANCIKNNWI